MSSGCVTAVVYLDVMQLTRRTMSKEVRKGFTWGSVTIVPLRADEEDDSSGPVLGRNWGPEDKVVIPFQNENLYVIRKSPGQKDQVWNTCVGLVGGSLTFARLLQIVVTVPDLITVLDSQSGSSIGTQEYRYGLNYALTRNSVTETY